MRGETLTTTADVDAALGIGARKSPKGPAATQAGGSSRAGGPAREGRGRNGAAAAGATGHEVEEEGSDASATYEAFDFEVDTDESADGDGEEAGAVATRGSPRGPSHREALENVVSQRRAVKKGAAVAGEGEGRGQGPRRSPTGGDGAGDGAGGEPAITYDPRMTLAYLSQRALPAFASARAVMTEVQARVPGFNPETVLDFGAGAGSSTAASRSVWDTVGEVTAVEPSQSMTEALRSVVGADVPDLRVRRSLTQLLPHVTGQDTPQHDLVLAHHVLSELPNDGARATAVALLWRMLRPGGIILISEFGDAFGSHTVRCARQMLIDESDRLQNQLREELPSLPRARSLPMEPRLRGAELKMALRSALRDRAKVGVPSPARVCLRSLTACTPRRCQERGRQVDVSDLVGHVARSASRLPVGSLPAEARAAAQASGGRQRGAAATAGTPRHALGKVSPEPAPTPAPAAARGSIADTIRPTDPPERFLAAMAEEQGEWGENAASAPPRAEAASGALPATGTGLEYEYEYVYEEDEEAGRGKEVEEGEEGEEALLDEVELTGLEDMSDDTEAQVMALTEEELAALPHGVASQIREVQRRVAERSGPRGSGPARGLHTSRTVRAQGGALPTPTPASGPEYEYVYEEVPSEELEGEDQEAAAAPAAGDSADGPLRVQTEELQRMVETTMGISEAESFTVPRAVVIAPCTHQHTVRGEAWPPHITHRLLTAGPRRPAASSARCRGGR